MNQSAAKASRREIRRAFGPQALAAVSETHQNTQATVQSVAFAHERIDGLQNNLGLSYDMVRLTYAITAEVRDHVAHSRIDGLTEDVMALEALRQRSFWGRLRWLLRGA